MVLQKKVIEYKKDVIQSIIESVQIKSIEEPPLPGKPFGHGPAKALSYFLKRGESMGFKVKNFDNYAGHIDYGNGDEIVGILGHVDVVPEGEGWDHDPYGGDIIDGKIYGRGTTDNKGPMITCLYAMKALKESGIKINKKIRMILGANEETGWEGIENYFNVYKMPQPDLAFTPDADFPLIFAEKGILRLSLKKKIRGIKNISLTGGTVVNSVPETATLKIPLMLLDSKYNIMNFHLKFNYNKNYKIDLEFSKDFLTIISHGKSCHAMSPQDGYNAISALFCFLNKIYICDDEFKSVLRFFQERIKMEYDGTSLGVNCSDEDSGGLTLNIGTTFLEDEILNFLIDIRYPVTISSKNISNKITWSAKKYGIDLEIIEDKKPLHVSKDSFLVTTLMNCYKDITGDIDAIPLATGGGTYARAVKNGVAFGALLKGQEDNMHQINEYLEVDKIDTWLKIYAEAIYRLAK
ncbi:dipeptidase PepV [uncultured Ilyobacter sp.]|uniref:dipeptidase PepV n=1 Tax=uncultured Ilyobacter sp. TaxID=544433 RepID=UPI0029F519C6|nr:dipeptidase PepV [uncultured Ilyobacter sp.]